MQNYLRIFSQALNNRLFLTLRIDQVAQAVVYLLRLHLFSHIDLRDKHRKIGLGEQSPLPSLQYNLSAYILVKVQ